MTINFFLNGRHYRMYNKLNLDELLTYFDFLDKIFIVEYNSKICNHDYWKFQIIKNNDKIEIISIVGGG